MGILRFSMGVTRKDKNECTKETLKVDWFGQTDIRQSTVAHPETSPPVLWTGKMHSWTG